MVKAWEFPFILHFSTLMTPRSFLPVTCSNGSWSAALQCVPARCKQIPPPPTNGMIVVADTNHGASGLYQCKGHHSQLYTDISWPQCKCFTGQS